MEFFGLHTSVFKNHTSVTRYFDSEDNSASLADILFVLAGLFSTLVVFRVYAFSDSKSLYAFVHLSLIFLCLADVVKRGAIRLTVSQLYFMSIISSLLVLYSSPLISYSTEAPFALMILSYLPLALLSRQTAERRWRFFISGLKLGAVINICWGIAEVFGWRLIGLRLNDLFLGVILQVDSGGHVLSNIERNGAIRAAGLSWEPSHLGILSSILAVSSKTSLGVMFGIAGLVLSQSRSAILGLICCYLFETLLQGTRRRRLVVIAFAPVVIITMALIFYNLRDPGATYETRRALYYSEALIHSFRSVQSFLFGGAPFSTGTALVHGGSANLHSVLEPIMFIANWRIESDWAGNLVGRGWIGFLAYFGSFSLVAFCANDKALRRVSAVILFSGIGYFFESHPFSQIVLHLGLCLVLQSRLSRRTKIIEER